MSRLVDELRELERAGPEVTEVTEDEVAQIISEMENMARKAAKGGFKTVKCWLGAFRTDTNAPLPCRPIAAITAHFQAQGIRIGFVQSEMCGALACTCTGGGKKHFGYNLCWD